VLDIRPSHISLCEGKLQFNSTRRAVQCPLSIVPMPPLPRRFPLSSHLADVLAPQTRTTNTAAVRRLSMYNPSTVRRPTKIPPTSPESSNSRGRVEAGTRLSAGRCAVGSPAPNPTPLGDRGTPRPLISRSDLQCTLCILCCCDVNALWLVARLCQVFIISSYTPHRPASKRRPALPRRHHAVVPGARVRLAYVVLDGRSWMTATPNQRLTGPSLLYKCGYQNSP